jgi:hypothetical protein
LAHGRRCFGTGHLGGFERRSARGRKRVMVAANSWQQICSSKWTAKPPRPDAPAKKNKSFFSTMKELTLVGSYTSEIGITQELLFQPATDKYEGCIPLERIGKAWAELD